MPMLTYDNRGQLYTLLEHSADVIQKIGKPDSGVWTSDKEGNVNLYGIELETSTDYSVKNIIDFFPDIFVICKKDSTITGTKNNSMEIVTIPASMRKHKRMWAAFFKQIDRDKFDTLDKHNNGMHVHIDRKAFEQDNIHLKKFCWFISSKGIQEFTTNLSERTKESLDKWSKFASAATSIANVENHTRELSKYSAVNLGKSATIEVRLFKGIVSFTSIIKNLEFVDAAVEFTRIHSLAEITLDQFLSWLDALPSSRYRTLRLCITDVDLEEIKFHADLAEFLTTKKAEKALQILKAGRFKSTIRFHKKIVSGFNDTYPGYKLTYSKKGWELTKITTKFAKFDDATLRMFTR